MHTQTNREYDATLVRTLQKLELQYANKKVRINTWDKQTDAYQDMQVLDEDGQLSENLTIGDSVQFVTIDLSQSDGIRAAIKLQNGHTGFIPYFKIEEFEPAMLIDPDLN